MESVTQKAIEAVGSKQDKDWKLHPDTHAAELSAAAGPLQRILLKPELGSIIAAFNSSDAQAGGAQTRYKKLAKISAVTSFIAVVIASLLLLFPHTIGDSPSLFTIAAVAQFGLLAVSYLASIWLGYAKPYDDWMHERAKAETRRIELFNTVVAASETPQGNELPTLPLQLEYVRRYQLDVQRAYYKGRGNQHRQAAQRSGLWRIASLIILGIALL